MAQALWRRAAVIATIRCVPFLTGVWSTHYADWRQAAGYLPLVVSSLPDALWVRYVVSPRSSDWPLAMIVSLLFSSAIVARWSLRNAPDQIDRFRQTGR